MKQSTHEFENGHITYRYPNVIEAFRLLPRIGVTTDGEMKLDEFEMAARIMESLEPYILEVKLDNKALQWAEVLEHYEMIPHLQHVGMDVVSSISQQNAERKERKK
jgi:translation initiation factor IF-1